MPCLALRTLHLVVSKGLSALDVLALAVIVRRLDAQGEPCLAQLTDCGATPSQARSCISRLVAQGFLSQSGTAAARRRAGRLGLAATGKGRALLTELLTVEPAPADAVASGVSATADVAPLAAPAPLSPAEVRELADLPLPVLRAVRDAAERGLRPDLEPAVESGQVTPARAIGVLRLLDARSSRAPAAPTVDFSVLVAGQAPAARCGRAAGKPEIEQTRVPLAGPAEIEAARSRGIRVPDIEAGQGGEEVARVARLLLAEAAVRSPSALSGALDWVAQAAWSCVRGELADLGPLSRRVRAAIALVRQRRWRQPRSWSTAPADLVHLRPVALAG
jgi:hypothetical protein